jgi:hypothetical protein
MSIRGILVSIGFVKDSMAQYLTQIDIISIVR